MLSLCFLLRDLSDINWNNASIQDCNIAEQIFFTMMKAFRVLYFFSFRKSYNDIWWSGVKNNLNIPRSDITWGWSNSGHSVNFATDVIPWKTILPANYSVTTLTSSSTSWMQSVFSGLSHFQRNHSRFF